MSASSPPRGPTVDVVQEKTTPNGWVATSITTIAIIPAIFALVFHVGAAYMSYQRNQSMGWAIVHFFLAVFYYPYYAFTQAGKPVEAPVAAPASILPTVQAAGRRLRQAVHGTKRK